MIQAVNHAAAPPGLYRATEKPTLHLFDGLGDVMNEKGVTANSVVLLRDISAEYKKLSQKKLCDLRAFFALYGG